MTDCLWMQLVPQIHPNGNSAKFTWVPSHSPQINSVQPVLTKEKKKYPGSASIYRCSLSCRAAPQWTHGMVEHLKNAARVPTWIPLGWEKQDEVASRVDFQWTRLKFTLWCFFSKQGVIKYHANVLSSAFKKQKNTKCPLGSSYRGKMQ